MKTDNLKQFRDTRYYLNTNGEVFFKLKRGGYRQTKGFVDSEKRTRIKLIKELSKDIRGKSKKNAIIEEIADVLIMIDQVKIIKDITDEDIENEILFKVTRLNNRLNEEQNGESWC